MRHWCESPSGARDHERIDGATCFPDRLGAARSHAIAATSTTVSDHSGRYNARADSVAKRALRPALHPNDRRHGVLVPADQTKDPRCEVFLSDPGENVFDFG